MFGEVIFAIHTVLRPLSKLVLGCGSTEPRTGGGGGLAGRKTALRSGQDKLLVQRKIGEIGKMARIIWFKIRTCSHLLLTRQISFLDGIS
jgi:hypothetical protein